MSHTMQIGDCNAPATVYITLPHMSSQTPEDSSGFLKTPYRVLRTPQDLRIPEDSLGLLKTPEDSSDKQLCGKGVEPRTSPKSHVTYEKAQLSTAL